MFIVLLTVVDLQPTIITYAAWPDNICLESTSLPPKGFQNVLLWVYVSYLSMGFLDTGIKKHPGQHRQQHLWMFSKGDADCVTFHRLNAYHLFLGSYFYATLKTGMAAPLRLYDQVLNSSWRDIYLNLSEIYQHQQQLESFTSRNIWRKLVAAERP